MFDTIQYTAGTGMAVVVILKQTKLNKDSQVSSEGKSLPLQDLGIYKTINESVIKLKLLLISMNVHPHPGPEFTKVICGTFNQGNNHKLGNMAGKQWYATALYSLAFGTIKDVRYWQSGTLDSILEHRTALYEKLGKDGFLIEDLPNQVEIFNLPTSTEFKFNSHGFLNRQHSNAENMKEMICTNSEYNETKLNTGVCLCCQK